MGHRGASSAVAVLLAVLLGWVLLSPVPAPSPALEHDACHAVSLGATATRPTVTDKAVAPTARSAPLTSSIHGNLPATSPAESRCPAPAALRVPPDTADNVDDGRARVSSLGSRAPPVAGY